MNGIQRVQAAYAFRPPDAVPLEYHPSARGLYEHGEALRALFAALPGDFEDYSDEPIPVPDPKNIDDKGEYDAFTTDGWGTVWEERIFGMVGHACRFPLENWGALPAFRPPPLEYGGANVNKTRIRVEKTHTTGRFAKLGFFGIFERMIALRGFEAVLMDLSDDSQELHQLADLLCAHFAAEIEALLAAGVDGVAFGDDFGTNDSMLVSPAIFRSFFAPRYRRLIAPIRAAGRKVHFHSCGNVWPILEDFKDIGVDSLWPQLAVYDLDELAAKLRHLQLAIALHPDRAAVMTRGTPADVHRAMQRYAKAFDPAAGGAWFYVEVDNGFPLQNIEAMLEEIALFR